MFDLPEHLSLSVRSLRVECMPHAWDCDGPVRLVLVGNGGEPLATLSFTPERARDAGPAIAKLLARFLPVAESERLADGLLNAAVRVWATRN